MKLKRILASLLAGAALLAMVGCGTSGKPSSSQQTQPKDYTQILHDARPEELNEYYMIFTRDPEGKFTAQYGYSEHYTAEELGDEVENMLLPLLNLQPDQYTDFAASLSSMMVQSYGVAIVKPVEGKTEQVVTALEDYIQNERQSMEHYLEDQYQIALNARVETMPTGEVVMVCCEDSDTVFANIKAALAA